MASLRPRADGRRAGSSSRSAPGGGAARTAGAKDAWIDGWLGAKRNVKADARLGSDTSRSAVETKVAPGTACAVGGTLGRLGLPQQTLRRMQTKTRKVHMQRAWAAVATDSYSE